MPVQINLEDYAKPWRPGVYPKSTTVIYNNQLWILNDTITGLFSSSDFEAEVANGDWIGRFTTEEELIRKQNLPTGFITGLTLSINSLDNTKIDIAPGAFTISDFSNLENISVNIIRVENPIVGITPAYLNTGIISYIAIDGDQNIIQQSTPFTNEQRRTLAILGAAIHSNLTNVNITNEIKAPIVAPTNQLHDLIRAIGSFNLEGNVYGPNGTNLQLNKTAGTVFGLGINGQNYLNPHQLDISAQTSLTFAYRLQNGFQYPDTNTIDPANYDNGGVLTPLLNNNKWQIQRIYLFQSGLTRIQPGQHQYDSLEDAEANLKIEQFETETNNATNSVFRSYLIVKKNATDLSDISQAKFIPVDKFGNVITGGVALTFASIIAALGYTPEDVANKATDFSTINDTLYPSVEAVKEELDLKLPKDFSSLTNITLPLVDTDLFTVVRGGVTYKVAKSEVSGGLDIFSLLSYHGGLSLTLTSDQLNFQHIRTPSGTGNTPFGSIMSWGGIVPDSGGNISMTALSDVGVPLIVPVGCKLEKVVLSYSRNVSEVSAPTNIKLRVMSDSKYNTDMQMLIDYNLISNIYLGSVENKVEILPLSHLDISQYSNIKWSVRVNNATAQTFNFFRLMFIFKKI